MNPLSIAGMVVGAAITIGGVRMFRRTTSFLSDSAQTTGRITDFTKEEATVDEGTGFYPTVSFKTPDGALHELRVSGRTAQEPKLGEKVKVAYDPQNPSNAWIAGSTGVWILPFLVTAAGLALMISSFVLR